ncbi:hypothetical protein SSPSH_001102 [Salinisphaera shabanensis E1L3A]|uniref:Uncharacterized protein n=1 Tax=Salinisphaera shabanensis E1L3A TaxID=1033802 RepID=U2EP97_9GAMM|nr:hypothetical protein SSPSH_001102 [Salinisphaera shabanensis E1L3A]
MHLIIDLHTARDDGVVERATVDRRAGADFHIVGNPYAPHLWNRLPAAAVVHQPEPTPTDDGIRFDRHTGADTHIVANAAVARDTRIHANMHAVAEYSIRSDNRAGGHHGVFTNNGVASDARLGIDGCGCRDYRTFVYASVWLRPVEKCCNTGKSQPRLLYNKRADIDFIGNRCRADDSRRLRMTNCVQLRGVLGERDTPRQAGVERTNAADLRLRIAARNKIETIGQHRERDRRRRARSHD